MAKNVALVFAFLVTACGSGEVVFSNFQIAELTATRALITFETDPETSCEIEYGLTPSALTERATDPAMEPGQRVTSHRVPIEDLSPATTYSWRARVVNDDDQVFFSELSTFETKTSTQSERGRNVALKTAGAQIADVSSNFGGAPNSGSFGAELAIDGKMSTEWSSNGDGDGAFVVILLPSAIAVDRIAFRSREMLDGTSIVRQIRVEPEGAAPIGPFDTPDPSVRYVFDLPTSIRSARWKISAIETTGGNTGAREIELWSSEAP